MPANKGQFLPFRLLIGFIMAAMIFVIILGAISYFRGLEIDVSRDRFYDGFKFAMMAPSADGSEGLVEKENIVFTGGSIYAGTLALEYHFERECIEFQAGKGMNIVVSDDGQAVEMLQRVSVDVYYQCILEPSGSDCETMCYVSFGSKPEF